MCRSIWHAKLLSSSGEIAVNELCNQKIYTKIRTENFVASFFRECVRGKMSRGGEGKEHFDS
jgi:hypothetical protein